MAAGAESDIAYWNEVILKPPTLGNLVAEARGDGEFVNADLFKQSPRKTKGGWGVRRFVSKGRFLFYFRTNGAKAPAKGVIYLHGASAIRLGEYGGQKFAFQIKPISPRHGKGPSGNVLPINANDGAVFTLAARSEADLNVWLRFISSKSGAPPGSPGVPRAAAALPQLMEGAVAVGLGGTGATVDSEGRAVQQGVQDMRLSEPSTAASVASPPQVPQAGAHPGLPFGYQGQMVVVHPGAQPAISGGQPLPAIPGGQHPLPAIPGGQQPLPAIPDGQPLPSLPGGQQPVSDGQHPLPPVPGGQHPIPEGREPLPPAPEGQEPLPVAPAGQQSVPVVPGGQPLPHGPGDEQLPPAVPFEQPHGVYQQPFPGGQPLPPQPSGPSDGAAELPWHGQLVSQPGGQPPVPIAQPQMSPPGMWGGPAVAQQAKSQEQQVVAPSGSLEGLQPPVQDYPPFQPNPALPNYQPYLYPGQTPDPAILEHFAPVGDSGQAAVGPGMPIPVSGPPMLSPGMTLGMGMLPPGMMVGVPGGMMAPQAASPMPPGYSIQMQRPAPQAGIESAGLQVPMPGGPKLSPGQIVKNQSGQLMIVLNNGMLMPLGQQPRAGAAGGSAAGAAAGRGRPLSKKEQKKAAAERERQAKALAKANKQKKK